MLSFIMYSTYILNVSILLQKLLMLHVASKGHSIQKLTTFWKIQQLHNFRDIRTGVSWVDDAQAVQSGLHDISRRINSTCLQPNEIIVCIIPSGKRPRFYKCELELS